MSNQNGFPYNPGQFAPYPPQQPAAQPGWPGNGNAAYPAQPQGLVPYPPPQPAGQPGWSGNGAGQPGWPGNGAAGSLPFGTPPNAAGPTPFVPPQGFPGYPPQPPQSPPFTGGPFPGYPPGVPQAPPGVTGMNPVHPGPPPPQQANQALRVCLSGSPVCSGCLPCNECLSAVRQLVLLPSMIAGGFAGSDQQASAFLVAYARAWDTLGQQIQQAVKSGQLVAQPVMLEALPGPAAQQPELVAMQGQANQPAPSVEIALPSAYLPPDPASELGSLGNAKSEPKIQAVPPPEPVVLGSPLTIEDVMAIAVPIPELIPMASNSLGNVMEVPDAGKPGPPGIGEAVDATSLNGSGPHA